MAEDPIEELLELENLFVEEDIIRLLSYDAVSKGRRIKLFPDGKEPIISSFFIPDERTDWASDTIDHVFIAPAKSDEENERIKKSSQIMVGYEHGRFNLEARRLTFLGEEKIGQNLAYRVTLPKIFQVAGRRKLVRHRIPAKMPCLVAVRKKIRSGDQSLKGILFDIHEEGFCFAAPVSSANIEKGDQLKCSLETRQKHFGVIHTIVRVLSKAQYRKAEGSAREYIYYGCGLLNVSDDRLMELYIAEVKAKETEIRKARRTSDLTEQLFGKIRQRSRQGS
ncbi:MAG: PilZ domain-containing protein [Magnetococcales bacterium]|nr:PilZ domain-containing protein [Magnetococcales bacterium]